jgi:hypothetical protein
MRPLRLFILICFGIWQCSVASFGAEFRLNNGDVLRGEAVSFNDDGLVVHLEIGGHSPRISWSKLTQETLQQLSKNPQAARFVEPFIDLPPVPKEKKIKKDFKIKQPPRVDRVAKPNFFASFATPTGVGILLVLILANVYAAFEIARYRHRPPALVCGASIIFPFIAPALILAMPPAEAEELGGGGVVEPSAAGQTTGKATTGSLAKVPMASGLSIAQGEKPAAASAGQAPQSYKRGEFTFNRRFMETKFASFFRIVQSEADKDLVLVVRCPKEDYMAKRISRISSNEMHLQLLRGVEVSVPFADIAKIQVRHKEAKT